MLGERGVVVVDVAVVNHPPPLNYPLPVAVVVVAVVVAVVFIALPHTPCSSCGCKRRWEGGGCSTILHYLGTEYSEYSE
jgi:hypothetical protein